MGNLEKHSAVLKRCYERWHETKGGNVDEWMAIFDDCIDFRSLGMGRNPGGDFTAPCVGKDAVKGYFDGLAAQWDMIHYTVDHFIEQGDTVCAIGSTAWTNKDTGKTIDSPKVDVWTFDGEKAVAFFEYFDTAAFFAASTP